MTQKKRVTTGGVSRVGTLLVVLGFAWLSGCGSADSADTGKPGTVCGRVVLDGGGGIEMPDDGSEAAECEPMECNLQSQTGCSATESCLPTVTNGAVTTRCFDAGSRQRGETCTGANECARGQACAAGNCRKLCCAGDWTACDEGESCYRQFEYLIDGEATPTGAWVCYPVGTCSVLDPNACDELGQDCKMVDSRGSEACVPKTPGKLGEACGAATGRLCGRGLACVGDPGKEKCIRLCRAEECGEPACPAAEGVCVHFDRDPPGVGECTLGW
jgi:hypothetical protein